MEITNYIVSEKVRGNCHFVYMFLKAIENFPWETKDVFEETKYYNNHLYE